MEVIRAISDLVWKMDVQWTYYFPLRINFTTGRAKIELHFYSLVSIGLLSSSESTDMEKIGSRLVIDTPLMNTILAYV
jgi:hypothetical protein